MAEHKVTVSIMGKSYQVVCPQDKADALGDASRYLDDKLYQLQQGGRARQSENLVMMSALNISHEYIMLRNQQESYIRTMEQRITELLRKIDDAITKQEEIELID